MATGESEQSYALRQPRAPIVWENVPQRNKNFTGRAALLDFLRSRLTGSATVVLPHALHGLGGVGKTQLAVEYAYRHQDSYDVVLWVSADQESLVPSTLAVLAPRLGIDGIPRNRVDEAAAAVLDALRRGEPYSRWLLVFDNADQPEKIRRFVPGGPGHVLVTSRNRAWAEVVDTVDVDVFSRAESLEFLSRRVPEIDAADAGRLADVLGDLPLALDQAAALLGEGTMSVDTYVKLLREKATELLAEARPTEYPVAVAAAWSLSVARLREQLPEALELLRRCAYFGPDPIRLELLDRGSFALGPPLRDVLADPIRRFRTIRELGRYALVRVDNVRKTLHMHRIIQALIRDEIDPAEREGVRHDVHQLLRLADPDNPEDPVNWPKYAELIPHAGPAQVLECQDSSVRHLVTNLGRYLWVTGDYEACLSLAQDAVAQWTEDSGPDDRAVLSMTKHIANAYFSLGRYQESFDLSEKTLARMRRELGENDAETLILTNHLGGVLRARGEFKAALELDEDSLPRHRAVFGENHPRTFYSANNLAVDYRLTSDYQKALELDRRSLAERRDAYGSDADLQVLVCRSAVAYHLQLAGDWAAARVEDDYCYGMYQDLVRQGVVVADNSIVLQQSKQLSVVRRLLGAYPEALELAREVYRRYCDRAGVEHPYTLAAAICLGNALRASGELAEAGELIETTVARYGKVLGDGHPDALSSHIDLAIIQRQTGNAAAARATLEPALAGLRGSVGEDHHYTLLCAANLVQALVDLSEAAEAQQLGAETLALFRAALGDQHPHTLACAAVHAAALDRLGRDEAPQERAAALGELRRTLGDDHPYVRAADGQRMDMDFDPQPA